MSPIIKELQKRTIDYTLVHTAQHYDHNLSTQFFDELSLPRPDYNLHIGSGSHADQTARVLVSLDKILQETQPSLVLVEGDTNTVLAAGLTAAKLQIPVAHVEAGLRSYDLRMPEEHNRRLVDHLSSYLFAPTEDAAQNLYQEHVWGEVHVTGNTVIDACLALLPLAEQRATIQNVINLKDRYALITLHRAENVDDAHVLQQLSEVLINAPIPLVFPVHPRTELRFKEAGLWETLRSSDHLTMIPPVGYLDFLILLKNAKLILTDSGGIQEEATAPNIRKFVLVLRKSTERPEAVRSGFAKVVGVNPAEILPAITEALARTRRVPSTSPYGDGTAGKQIIQILNYNKSFRTS